MAVRPAYRSRRGPSPGKLFLPEPSIASCQMHRTVPVARAVAFRGSGDLSRRDAGLAARHVRSLDPGGAERSQR